jgi:hypothetical protein
LKGFAEKTTDLLNKTNQLAFLVKRFNEMYRLRQNVIIFAKIFRNTLKTIK